MVTGEFDMAKSLIVRKVPGLGRGIFAGRAFRRGQVIEVCPVIPIRSSEANACSFTILDDYFFEWGLTGKAYALLLGYGALYNHAANPNATYVKRVDKLQMVFRAVRDIEKGEQITIDYGWTDGLMPPPRGE